MPTPCRLTVALISALLATEGNMPAASSGIARHDALGVQFHEPVEAEIVTSDVLDVSYSLSMPTAE
jgi:hypothetical protein